MVTKCGKSQSKCVAHGIWPTIKFLAADLILIGVLWNHLFVWQHILYEIDTLRPLQHGHLYSPSPSQVCTSLKALHVCLCVCVCVCVHVYMPSKNGHYLVPIHSKTYTYMYMYMCTCTDT